MRRPKPILCVVLALVLMVLLAGEAGAVKPPIRQCKNQVLYGDPDWVEHCREREESRPGVTEEYGFEQDAIRVIAGFVLPRSLFSRGVSRKSLPGDEGRSDAAIPKTAPTRKERSRWWSRP